MASIVAQLQTAWFLDPQNTSTTAADTNDGRTETTPLRSTAEFFRRVGVPLVLGPNQEVVITFLSSLREEDRFQLEVIGNRVGEVGDSGRVVINGTIVPDEEGTVENLSPSDQLNNVVADVSLSFTGPPNERNTRMLYVAERGYMPYAVDQGGEAPEIMNLDRAYDPAFGSSLIEEGDTVTKFVPVSLRDVAFLKADASSGAQIEVNGVRMTGLAAAEGVTFRGCLISNGRGVRDCLFQGCTLGASGPCQTQFNNTFEGCLFRNHIAQGSSRIQGGMIDYLILDPQAFARVVGVAFFIDSLIEIGTGGRMVIDEANGLFGPNGSINLASGAAIVREGLGSITIPSDPAIQWPGGAPLTEVYDADTILPGGTPANPASSSWAEYNGGESDGNWIHWRSGARLTKE